MKFRLPFLIVFLAVMAAFALSSRAYADLVWNTPYGKIGIPLTQTETLIGYGAISKQAIAGASVPVYTDPKSIVTLAVGAVAPWPTNGPAVEPYISAGHNIFAEIPGLNQYKNVKGNVFGRYVTETGKADVGVSISYQFSTGQ